MADFFDEEEYGKTGINTSNLAYRGIIWTSPDIDSAPQRRPLERPDYLLFPERDPYDIKESYTAKLLHEKKMARAGQIVSYALTSLLLVLGIVAVVRFANIFEISKTASNLEKQTAKQASIIATEEAFLTGSKETADSKAAAEKLGLQLPQTYQKVNVDLIREDVTEVYKSSVEGETETKLSFSEQIKKAVMDFLGIINMK